MNVHSPLEEVAGRIRRTRFRSDRPSVATGDLTQQRNASARILLVDDEPGIIEIVELCLSADGYFIESASDGASGLERFRGGNWDLVLLDRCMPQMNGCELAAAIRSLAPDVPIVLLTGLPGLLDEDATYAHAIDAVVCKPFTLSEFRETVKRALKPDY